MSFDTAFFIFSICVNFVNLIILFRLSTLKCFFLLLVTFLSNSSHFLFSLENLEHATWTMMLTNFIPFDLFLVLLKRRIKLNTSQKSRVCHSYLSSLPSCYPLCKPQIWFFEKRASYFLRIGRYFMFTKRWQTNTVFEKLESHHSSECSPQAYIRMY